MKKALIGLAIAIVAVSGVSAACKEPAARGACYDSCERKCENTSDPIGCLINCIQRCPEYPR